MLVHTGGRYNKKATKARCMTCNTETRPMTAEDAREADRIHKQVFHSPRA